MKALTPLAWTAAHLLTALSDTENDPAYAQKAAQILEILLSCDPENVAIRSIRRNVSE